jgi:hypothetical protein
MPVRTLTSAGGEEMVVLSRAEYQDLLDSLEHAETMRDIAAGRVETLGEEELDEYLSSATPLAFWRKRRGIAAQELADGAGIAPERLAALEAGTEVGDVWVYSRLAQRLRLRMDSIVPVEHDAAGATAPQ